MLSHGESGNRTDISTGRWLRASPPTTPRRAIAFARRIAYVRAQPRPASHCRPARRGACVFPLSRRKRPMSSRRRQVYEGKAKIMYEGPEPGTLIQYFKDDATAFNAQKKGTING